jgi:RNA polymerase sigma-70 factor (ECF subfamily)
MIRTITMQASSITGLLRSWQQGRQDALDELTAVIYPQLRRLAEAVLRREAPGHTLQPTALVHEVYLRLVGPRPLDLNDRAHFLGIAGRIMRQILIEHARRKQSAKRRPEGGRLPLEDGLAVAAESSRQVLELDAALTDLAQVDERKARVVEMRYFGGLTEAEIGAVLGVTSRTVERDLRFAHGWLYRQMTSSPPARRRDD